MERISEGDVLVAGESRLFLGDDAVATYAPVSQAVCTRVQTPSWSRHREVADLDAVEQTAAQPVEEVSDGYRACTQIGTEGDVVAVQSDGEFGFHGWQPYRQLVAAVDTVYRANQVIRRRAATLTRWTFAAALRFGRRRRSRVARFRRSTQSTRRSSRGDPEPPPALAGFLYALSCGGRA